MRKALRSRLVAGLATLGIVASLLVVAPGTAEAYPTSELSVRGAQVDTSNCEKFFGSLEVIAYPNGCKLRDTADHTFFRKDKGGKALKIELRHDREMIGKVEFHPYGEYLWVYDTKNDGDTIYVKITAWIDGVPHTSGPYRPPGTSNRIDYRKINKSYPENTQISITIYDDINQQDLIANSGARS